MFWTVGPTTTSDGKFNAGLVIDATIAGLVGFEMSMTVSWLELNAVTYA